jgi:hypothetical protein
MATRRVTEAHRRGGLRRRRPAGGVADPDQQRDQHEVGHERRPAVGQERRRQPGQWQQSRDTPEDDEHLPGDGEGQARGQQLAEGVPHDQGGAQTALDEDQVDDDHGDQAEQAEFLAHRRGDEVALRDRHLIGPAAAEAGAEDPSGAEAEQ